MLSHAEIDQIKSSLDGTGEGGSQILMNASGSCAPITQSQSAIALGPDTSSAHAVSESNAPLINEPNSGAAGTSEMNLAASEVDLNSAPIPWLPHLGTHGQGSQDDAAPPFDLLGDPDLSQQLSEAIPDMDTPPASPL